MVVFRKSVIKYLVDPKLENIRGWDEELGCISNSGDYSLEIKREKSSGS
jgi:hypothetical protein